MKKSEFWALIALIDQNRLDAMQYKLALVPLIETLSEKSTVELESFMDYLYAALDGLNHEQYRSNTESKDTDAFEYARLYVIGRGEKFYHHVKNNPVDMPSGLCWFEELMYVPDRAWCNVTGLDADDWDYTPAAPGTYEV